MKKEEIIEVIKELVAKELKIDVDEIDEDENFMRLGLDSLAVACIVNEIEEKLDVEISAVAMFEYKTISEFAEYIANGGEEA